METRTYDPRTVEIEIHGVKLPPFGKVESVKLAPDQVPLKPITVSTTVTRRSRGRLYIAGGSDERLQVARPYIQRTHARGWEITYDWTLSPGYSRAMTDPETYEQVAEDLDGIKRADVVWFLCPENKSEGAASEFGFALALGKHIIVSGPWRRHIFFHHASFKCDRHEEAFEILCADKGRRG